jgi:hypothetical protein
MYVSIYIFFFNIRNIIFADRTIYPLLKSRELVIVEFGRLIDYLLFEFNIFDIYSFFFMSVICCLIKR